MAHPKFLFNPLYIGGDSYSGITVPMLVQEISNGIEVGDEPLTNIRGFLLGNPYTDLGIDMNARIQFAHRMTLLSDQLYKSTKEECNGEYFFAPDPSNVACITNLQAVKNIYNMVLSYIWANDKTVQAALHVREGIIKGWERCNSSLNSTNYAHDITSSVSYQQNLTKKGFHALIYSGDHDMVVPHVGTQQWIKSLNLTIKDDWRPWFVNSQIAGYVTMYSKNKYILTYATGAGHTASEYKPMQCLAMVDRIWFFDYCT
ncbi:hypothetical protein GH714_031106 [Hevea brasiliensis]|nr:hypothetical protein GH714_031106 [Hevea brasiliensis]